MTLDAIISPGTEPEVLGAGYGFTEGPAADGEGNVYFSDGKHDSIHYWQAGRPPLLFTDQSTAAIGMMHSATSAAAAEATIQRNRRCFHAGRARYSIRRRRNAAGVSDADGSPMLR